MLQVSLFLYNKLQQGLRFLRWHSLMLSQREPCDWFLRGQHHANIAAYLPHSMSHANGTRRDRTMST